MDWLSSSSIHHSQVISFHSGFGVHLFTNLCRRSDRRHIANLLWESDDSCMSVGASIVVAGVGVGGVLRGPSDVSKWAKLDMFERRKRTASVGFTPLIASLVVGPMGFLPRVKRGGFVLKRATKPGGQGLIAQNSPQDGLQTRATSGLVFAKQAVAADRQQIAGGGSSGWQQADSGSKQAGLVTRQGARQGAKMARNTKCASFVAIVVGRVRQAAGEQSPSSRALSLPPLCLEHPGLAESHCRHVFRALHCQEREKHDYSEILF